MRPDLSGQAIFEEKRQSPICIGLARKYMFYCCDVCCLDEVSEGRVCVWGEGEGGDG